MAKLKLILTADYEVFGNGSGHVKNCLTRPAEEIMRICESHDTRVTFFTEVCEYWAFREMQEQGWFSAEYRPASWMEEQLKDAVKRGHDLQLHFHPQWLEYEMISDQEWKLNYDLWRLPNVPDGSGNENDPKSISGLFAKGKKTLEDLARSGNPDYQCRAFRAGSWCIQPEEEILKVMANTGILYDTTVAPGVKLDDNLSYYDFRNAPEDLPSWNISNKVDRVDESGKITEVPIFTADLNSTQQIQFQTTKKLRRISNRPENCTGEPATKTLDFVKKDSKFKKIVRLYTTRPYMLDFCGTSFDEMMFLIEAAKKRYRKFESEEPVPIVAIGHPKNFGNPKEFKSLLEWVDKKDFIELESLEEKSFWQA